MRNQTWNFGIESTMKYFFSLFLLKLIDLRISFHCLSCSSISFDCHLQAAKAQTIQDSLISEMKIFVFRNSFFICRPEQSTDRMTDILSWSIRSQNGKEERNKLVHKWLTCVWRQLLQLMHTHTCIQITNRFVLMKNRFQINWCLEIGFLLMSGDKIILEHSQWMTICVFSVWNWLLWIAKKFILTNAKPQTI